MKICFYFLNTFNYSIAKNLRSNITAFKCAPFTTLSPKWYIEKHQAQIHVQIEYTCTSILYILPILLSKGFFYTYSRYFCRKIHPYRRINRIRIEHPAIYISMWRHFDFFSNPSSEMFFFFIFLIFPLWIF